MQLRLELLAPAKNKDIGIAAISCGADAVYIAGPSFGAREAAGNSIEDIAELAEYAAKFGAKVYLALNTILYDHELESARELVNRAYSVGCSAVIVQDLALLGMDLPPIRLFASTQTNIRSVEQALFLKNLGFERLILARELTLDQIAEIKRSVGIEVECFVHGALCVSYSGQCYLSEFLTGRSANRGRCAQACRSLYSLVDSGGRVLVENKPLLSLKDLNLSGRMADLIKAGVTSFKIEGRLKNESYVKNIVRLYSEKLDEFIASNPGYVRSSLGIVEGGFVPNADLTFNRGYTSYNIDGVRRPWNSGEAARYIGEPVASISKSGRDRNGFFWFEYRPAEKGLCEIVNGDGLYLIAPSENGAVGLRANSCSGKRVSTLERCCLPEGTKIYRNFNFAFEKELEKNMPERKIPVDVSVNGETIVASVPYGEEKISVELPVEGEFEPAQNQELAERTLFEQLSKRSGIFSFRLVSVKWSYKGSPLLPFFPVSRINGMRRALATLLGKAIMERFSGGRECRNECKPDGRSGELSYCNPVRGKNLSYLANCSNSLSARLYSGMGAESVDDAYEISHRRGVELMRTKYCLKFELGLCRKNPGSALNSLNGLNGEKADEPLFLLNGKKRLELRFDCLRCEMVIIG